MRFMGPILSLVLASSTVFASPNELASYGTDQILLADTHICRGLIKAHHGVPEMMSAQKHYGNPNAQASYEKLGVYIENQIQSLNCRSKLQEFRRTCEKFMIQRTTLEARQNGYFAKGSTEEIENAAKLSKVNDGIYSLECDLN